MAIRYVKDFEFPSAAGFTDSATKVTGQMYAKGGEAKAPKGKEMVLLIGVGMPKKGPMKKAEGGYSDMDEYMSELEKRSPIQSGTYGKKKPEAKKKAPPKRYIPGTNVEASDILDAEERARLERGYKSGGKVAKVMHEFGEGKLHSGSKKGPEVTNPKQAMAIALSEAGKSKKAKGGIEYIDGGKDTSVPVKDIKKGKVKQSRDADYYREMEQTKKPAMKKGGAMKHEDVEMDRKLVKEMIKPAALKKADGGMAEKKMMNGGMAARSPLQEMGMAPRGMSLKQARGVPVGSRAPMIAPPSMGAKVPMAAPMGSRGVGVNKARPGKPDVSAIRSAMAKAATAARPESSPAMMKRGGKTSMSKC
jgi:hypothetical protein